MPGSFQDDNNFGTILNWVLTIMAVGFGLYLLIAHVSKFECPDGMVVVCPQYTGCFCAVPPTRKR